MCSIIDGYHFSTLNPNADVFIPKDPRNVMLYSDLKCLDIATEIGINTILNEQIQDAISTYCNNILNYNAMKCLDDATEIAINAIWKEQIQDAVSLYYNNILEEEIANEIADIRASH